MIKVACIDLDGTLFLNHGSSVYDLSLEAIKALELFKKNNIKVFICSGRAPAYIEKLCDKYELEKTFAAYNGACIYQNGKPFQSHGLSNFDVIKIDELFDGINLVYDTAFIQTNTSKRALKDSKNHHYERYKNLIKSDNVKAEISDLDYLDFLKVNKDEISKFSILTFNNDQANKIYEKMSPKLKDDYSISTSSKIFVEITNKKAYKGQFVNYLLELGYKKDEIAAIGDSYNDLSMFNKVDYSYLMSHSEKSLQEIAYKVVDDVYQACLDILKVNKNEI